MAAGQPLSMTPTTSSSDRNPPGLNKTHTMPGPPQRPGMPGDDRSQTRNSSSMPNVPTTPTPEPEDRAAKPPLARSLSVDEQRATDVSFQPRAGPRRSALFRTQTAGSSAFQDPAAAGSGTSGGSVDPSANVLPNTDSFPDLHVSLEAPRMLSSRAQTEGYSPRLSYSVLPMLADQDKAQDDDAFNNTYKGFHRSKGLLSNVPPLAQPIKPRFKKKGSSLLGKLIHSNRKNSDPLAEYDASDASSIGAGAASTNALVNNFSSSPQTQVPIIRKSVSSNGSSKHKFRLPSITLHHHLNVLSDASRHPSVLEESSDKASDRLSNLSSKKNSVSGGTETPKKAFNLDLNLEELLSILKNPPNKGFVDHEAEDSPMETNPIRDLPTGEPQRHNAWKAPDSWDVSEHGFYSATASNPVSESESDSEKDFGGNEKSKLTKNSLANSSKSSLVLDEGNVEALIPVEKKSNTKPGREASNKNLPVLFGTLTSKATHGYDPKTPKGPNHIVRVFKEDNTFTTIRCPLETSAAELLVMIKRKFFLETIANFQLSLHIGNNVKLLEPFEKPIKIQAGLLLLSGYTANDNLSILGREDLSFICKIVVENMALRNLTHEEEISLSKNYVNVDISNHNLKTIPIIFHQHTFEIERLNVSDNPAIYIPLDFIQSCTDLTSIKFSRNGCSKFPLNFLEARSLTSLLMDANFLDEIPAKISHLDRLESLRLNSNQLFYLPKSFGKLNNLVSLNLSSNNFKKYPECINELNLLQDLDLSYNDLSELPESIGKLTRLIKLNLCTNKLSKTLPQGMSKLVHLKRLDLRYNRISNIDVLGLLPNLEVVYASKNMISKFSDKMERLRLLHFDRNPATSLEFEIMLHMLTVLDLSKAKITAIPPEFVNKIPHVEKVVLDKNHLVTLPPEIGNLPKLAYLSLFGNNLQSIPSTIGKLLSLQYLDLHLNNIESLPQEIWNLKKLSHLNVSSNILSSFPEPLMEVAAKIPTSLIYSPSESFEPVKNGDYAANKQSLSESLLCLSIADNSLNEDSFDSISLLTHLKVLNLSYNAINEIPDGVFRRLRHLTDLFLSGNNLTKLPAEDLENLTELRWLFLNGNKMQTLPPELSKCQNLTHLDVGSNLLRYNISNWPYDWNWCYNKKLKFLNFSGNKRFEIKQNYSLNPETDEPYDSLLVLKDLKVIGLMDVTLTTPNVPDQSVTTRVRTTSSELDYIGYGVSDAMGTAEAVAFRDSFIQKFRGNENEVLIMSCDGIGGSSHGKGHLISFLAKQLFITHFTNELDRLQSDSGISDALRRSFLSLNKDVNSVLASKKAGTFSPSSVSMELNNLSLAEDANKGCCMSVVYIKNGIVYSANLGDIEILLSKTNADYRLLSTKHDPTLRKEFERIRASGGYVSGEGELDGVLPVSRGVGFFDFIPHTHSGPSISIYDPAGADAVIIMGTKTLWDYLTYDLAVDLARQEKDDPMLAAEKLRDHAICYGASERISVTVISIGDQKKKRQKLASSYMNLGGHDNENYTGKKRRDRGAPASDNALRRLNDEIEPPVGKLALVFTDIKNSTLLWDAYPVAMRSAIKLHNTIMRRQLRIVGGYEVKTEGDSFMVSFLTPTSALLWCFNVQNQLLTEDWPTEILETNECCEVTDSSGHTLFRGLSVRMGIHWGAPVCELDMVTRRMDYFGPMVNRASRIESSADGGQIAVSSDFLMEMEQLYFIHEQIESGVTTVQAAYEGNVAAGEIIETEIASLEEAGCTYYELGERKLKGLETPEKIALAFPNNLAMRYEIFKKRMSQDAQSPGRIIGALPVESVLSLRSLSLRLENICSVLSSGFNSSENTFKNSLGDIYTNTIKNNNQESDVVSLFDHLVTRIEHCVAMFELRQSYEIMNGGDGLINFTESLPMWTLIDTVRQLMESQRLKPAEEIE